MQNLLLVRRDSYDNQLLKDTLIDLRFQVCDICKIEQIQIKKIASNRELDVRFKGKSIADFDHIIYLNTPARNYSTDDEIFASTEFEAALRVALKVSGVRLFNSARSAYYNRGLMTPIIICNQLQKLGWKVPSVFYSYDGQRANKLVKEISPSPHTQDCYYLYLTRYDYFLIPGLKVHFLQQAEFLDLISKTQEYMSGNNHDFLVIGIFKKDSEFYVYSDFTDLPPETNTTILKRLLLDVLV